jgi:signal peptidase I
VAIINFDDPGFPYALLAIFVGLRMALFVIERLSAAQPDPPVVPEGLSLAPDDTTDTAETLPPLRVDAETAAEIETLAAVPAADDDAADAPVSRGGQHRLMHEVLDSAVIAVILVFFLIRPFLLQAFYIPSGSMIPTLQIGDKVLATKIIYRLREPRTGDVVVFHAPRVALETNSQRYDPKNPIDYVKRVIATPGDRVRITYDAVYLNDKKLNEPYVANTPGYDFPLTSQGDFPPLMRSSVANALLPHIKGRDLVVPKGYLLVLGDNRTESHDGHAWGLLKRNAVVGKAITIFWPPKRWRIIR